MLSKALYATVAVIGAVVLHAAFRAIMDDYKGFPQAQPPVSKEEMQDLDPQNLDQMKSFVDRFVDATGEAAYVFHDKKVKCALCGEMDYPCLVTEQRVYEHHVEHKDSKVIHVFIPKEDEQEE